MTQQEELRDDRLWTVEDVMAYLGVSRALVYRLPIRFSKIGGTRRYDPADVKGYVALRSSRPSLLRRVG
jgi:predicted DNA-binding transcriptional regulator AlpA